MSEWWEPRKPGEIGNIPWLAEPVIEYFENLLKPGMSVLEHGSGGSTLWLAQRVAHVTSIEHDEGWHNQVIAIAPKNVTMILHQSNMMPAVKGKFDILFIDGDPVTNRKHYLDAAPALVRLGGWVILDNCNRPEYTGQRRAMQDNCRYYVSFINVHRALRYCNTEFYRVK